MTQVYIDNNEIQVLNSKGIYPSFQLNNVAKLDDRQTSYTNIFKAPKTPSNIKALSGYGLGVYTRIPYKKHVARIFENGIEIIKEGIAEISEYDDRFYKIKINGAEKNFFNKITGLTLKDVFPSTLIRLNAQTISQHLLKDDQFIFTLTYNGAGTKRANLLYRFFDVCYLETHKVSPQFFAKSLFKNIFDHLGYSVEYDLLNFDSFQNLLLSPSQSVTNITNTYGLEIDIKELVPTMSIEAFLKEIMNRYALLISVNERDKIVIFKQMNELLTNGEIVDWSKKFHKTKSASQALTNYGQTNVFKFNDDVDKVQRFNESEVEGITEELTGKMIINNELLESEKTVFQSAFYKPTYAPLEYDENGFTLFNVFSNYQGNFKYFRLIDQKEYSVEIVQISDHFDSLGAAYVNFINTYASAIPFDETKTGQARIDDILDPSEILDFDEVAEIKTTFYQYKSQLLNILPQVLSQNDIISKLDYFEILLNDLGNIPVDKVELSIRYLAIKEEMEKDAEVFGTPTTSFNLQLYYRTKIDAPFKYNLFTPSGTQEFNLPYAFIATYIETSLEPLIGFHYQAYRALLNNYNLITCEINLNVLDIHFLDFFKRYYIKQLGGYFYLNKVRNFIANKLTTCELVKIPEIVLNDNTEEPNYYYYGYTGNDFEPIGNL